MQFKKVNEQFALAGQLTEEDIQRFVDEGYRSFMCNRPDGEGGECQPLHSDLAAVATRHSAPFYYLPMNPWDEPTEALCSEFARLFINAPKPLLVFCRTGNRSGILYEAARHLIEK